MNVKGHEITSGIHRNGCRWKPSKEDDLVNSTNPAPRNGERDAPLNQVFGRIAYEKVRAVHAFCVNNGIVNGT
jgi:hypothetical protein